MRLHCQTGATGYASGKDRGCLVRFFSTPLQKNTAPEEVQTDSDTHPAFLEGKSEAARQLYNYVALVAPTPLSVLINGASGTGKEYVAHRIHQLSKRADKPFVAIDCGAMLKELATSEFSAT